MLQRYPRLLSVRRAGLLPVLLVLLWWATVTWWVHSPLLPSPQAVLERGWEQLRSGALWTALQASIVRAAWGLLWGVLAGVLVGALLGTSRWADRLVGPTFHTVKQISLFAWIPMLTVWLGLGEASKIAFIAMAAFFPMVLNTHEGLRSVPKKWMEVAQVYGFTPWQWVRQLLAPAIAPALFTGLQLAIIYGWLATLGAEYLLTSGQGIGNTLIDGRERFEMDLVLFGVVVIGLVGAVLNTLLELLRRRLLAWSERVVNSF